MEIRNIKGDYGGDIGINYQSENEQRERSQNNDPDKLKNTDFTVDH